MTVNIPGLGGFQFTGDDVRDGLNVGLAATGSALTGGLWDGGDARCDPSFATSAMLAGIGRDLLVTAATMGAGEAWAAARAAKAAKAARDAEQAAADTAEACDGINGCFLAGTKVATEGGHPAIDKVAQGGTVLSRPEKAGDKADKSCALSSHTDAARVDQTTTRTVPTVVTVTVGDSATGPARDQVTATPEHPLYALGRGWTPVRALSVGDALATRAGPPLVVQKVEWHQSAQGFRVCNMTVHGDHTYFVGNANGGVWAHNIDCVKEPLDNWRYLKHPDSKPLGPDAKPGDYVYVRDTDGVVHIAPDGPHMHPQVLGGAQPASGAGTLTIGPDGTVTSIDNASGTFQFGPESVQSVANSVQGQGIPVAPGAVRGFQW